jgi:hypothetical protein
MIRTAFWPQIEDAAIAQVIFVIHAMPVSEKIKRQDRKRRKKGT